MVNETTEAEKILYILDNCTVSLNKKGSDHGEIVTVKKFGDDSGFLIYTKETGAYLVDGPLCLSFHPSDCRFKNALHLIVYQNVIAWRDGDPPASMDETVLIEGPPDKIQKLVEYLGYVYLG